MKPMTCQELLSLPPFTTIEIAARALGIGRTRAYELAKQGQFPCKVIRIGTSYRVVTADLQRMAGVEQHSSQPQSAPTQRAAVRSSGGPPPRTSASPPTWPIGRRADG